tara:strand:+ start:851 stop:1084 length:234 start_codon:yes stop_codon:yes gene_type:complete
MIEKAEDIIYYEEPADDGTMWYRCDYKGVAIRKPKSMFDGLTELEIKQVFFEYINTEIDETVYDISKNAESKTSEGI